MKPTLLTTALLFALTPMQAASLSTTDTSNYDGSYFTPPNIFTGVLGHSSIRFENGFDITLISTPRAAYGSISLFLAANSGIDGVDYSRPTSDGIPKYFMHQVMASGTAAFSDALTLFTGGINSGTVAFTLWFPGYWVLSGEVAEANGSFTAGSKTALGNRGNPIHQTLITTFALGQAIPISAFLSGYAIDAVPNLRAYGSGGISAGVGIESIQVFDEAGNPLSGYSYSSESNAPYPFLGGTAVELPEPGSFALMGIGAMMLCRWRVVKKASI
jgi:hypothetical protein